MDNYGDNGEQVKPDSNRPSPAGMVVLVIALLAVLGVFAWKLGWLSDLNPFSTSAAPIEMSIEPAASSDNTLPREYSWKYDGRDWELTMQIPEYLYLYYSRMERAPVEDYSIYVTHPKDDDELIAPLAGELKKWAAQRGYDPEETVNFAASFVQNLKYRLEDEEYPNYPVETLVDKSGDCEDMAILAAALLQAMGYDAVLIRFTSATKGEAGHMAVGVVVTGVSGGYSYAYDAKNYYYLETTSPWPVGDMPPEVLSKYQGKSDAIYKLEPAPALRFSGELSYSVARRWFSDATVDLDVAVTNWGTANAEDFYVRAYFEGYESGAKSSPTYDLPYGYQISDLATEGIVMPSGAGTLHVELWLGGKVVDDWVADIS